MKTTGSVTCAGEAQEQLQISVDIEHPSVSMQQSSSSQAALLANHKMNTNRLRMPCDMEVVERIIFFNIG
ncbi:hypothetical protein HZB60_03440 [candidate division KSB1 bacterium]|nr:hypothetical protein [candidate division KSB1 bacterium]